MNIVAGQAQVPVESGTENVREAGRRLRLPGGFALTPLRLFLLAIIAVYAFVTPGDLLYKLDALGFGVCHQISKHSFFIDNHQMPLCARCSGMYLSAGSAMLLMLVLRGRSTRLPVGGMLAILAVFFLAMAADGVNSTLQSFGAGFWDSTNVLRIFTGGLAGIAVAFFFYPMFNMSLWNRSVTNARPLLENPLQLAGYMVGAGLLTAFVLNNVDWLFYPLAILSVGSMLTLLAMANTTIVLMFLRREGTARNFSEALTPLLIGLIIALAELTLLVWGRSIIAPFMTSIPGMPLAPGLQ